jgi:LacI family transcriptional regulator
MNSKTTLKQLSKELNVSVSTVSKALNNSPEISDKTIKRVKELAKLYGYKPNPVAVSLKRNKTNTIGILIPDILNHFFAKVLFGIEQEASKQGYKIITCLTNESLEKEKQYLEMLEYNKVDGIIAALSRETQVKEELDHYLNYTKASNALVLFDRVNENIKCDEVLVDDFEAGQKIFDYLEQQNRNNIAVISTIPHLSVSKARLQGVDSAAKSKNKSFETLLIQQEENAEELISNLLSTHKTDAVIALDEYAGVTAINMAKKNHLDIPKEIAIVGFTNGLLANNSYPKMSVIAQHAIDIGQKTVELLLKRIENKDADYIRYIQPTSLLKRGSSE